MTQGHSIWQLEVLETVFPSARTDSDKKRRDNDHDDLEAVGYAA